MSNQVSQGFWGNLSSAKLAAALLLASSISLMGISNFSAAVMAQTTGNDSMGIVGVPAGGSSANSNGSSQAASNAASSAAGAATSAATSNAASAATSADSTSAGSAAATESGLWTAPKYAVKEIPQAKQTTKSTTTTTTTTATTPAATSNSTIYDDKEAKDFADNVTMPQYVWTRNDKKTKGQKTDALNASKEMSAYNRQLVEKFVANMVVPNNATLVESSQSKYLYLISFTIDGKGKINHVNSEKTYGSFNAVNIADDNENKMMTSAITQALSKCSPLAVPPAGIAPWYMLLRFEPNTGKVYVANLNTI
jgi:hypothetical protein